MNIFIITSQYQWRIPWFIKNMFRVKVMIEDSNQTIPFALLILEKNTVHRHITASFARIHLDTDIKDTFFINLHNIFSGKIFIWYLCEHVTPNEGLNNIHWEGPVSVAESTMSQIPIGTYYLVMAVVENNPTARNQMVLNLQSAGYRLVALIPQI